jgi:hypothetical protein
VGTGWQQAAGVAAAVAVLAGCGTVEGGAWVAARGKADAWVAGMLAAGTDRAALAAYLADTVVYDARDVGGGVTTGRWEYLREQQDLGTAPTVQARVYVDSRGVVLQHPFAGRQLLVVLDIGGQGIERRRDIVMDGEAAVVRRRDGWQVWRSAGTAGSCPGARMVASTYDGRGRVGRRVLTAAADAERCGGLTTGWWTRGLPAALPDRVSGTVSTTAGPIALRHAPSSLRHLVLEELARFDSAGLEPPVTPAIAFDPYDERCAQAAGWFDLATHRILICDDADSICTDGRCWGEPSLRRVLRHELAHAWVETYAAAAARQSFLRTVGATEWEDPQQTATLRGIEWAAETVAWGVARDGSSTPPSLRHPDCAVLALAYLSLTGHAAPLTCRQAA